MYALGKYERRKGALGGYGECDCAVGRNEKQENQTSLGVASSLRRVKSKAPALQAKAGAFVLSATQAEPTLSAGSPQRGMG